MKRILFTALGLLCMSYASIKGMEDTVKFMDKQIDMTQKFKDNFEIMLDLVSDKNEADKIFAKDKPTQEFISGMVATVASLNVKSLPNGKVKSIKLTQDERLFTGYEQTILPEKAKTPFWLASKLEPSLLRNAVLLAHGLEQKAFIDQRNPDADVKSPARLLKNLLSSIKYDQQNNKVIGAFLALSGKQEGKVSQQQVPQPMPPVKNQPMQQPKIAQNLQAKKSHFDFKSLGFGIFAGAGLLYLGQTFKTYFWK